MYCGTTNCVITMVCDVSMLSVKTMVSGVAINSLEITLICNDVRIGPAHE